MTKEEARQQLAELSCAITLAVQILSRHKELMLQFQREKNDMDNFGHITHPALWRDPERRAVAAIVAPLYEAALTLIETYEQQIEAAKAALEKVKP